MFIQPTAIMVIIMSDLNMGVSIMRERRFQIIEVGKEDDKLSRAYDFFMMATIIISIIPLWSHEETSVFYIIDKVTVVIFIADYILRLFTADL